MILIYTYSVVCYSFNTLNLSNRPQYRKHKRHDPYIERVQPNDPKYVTSGTGAAKRGRRSRGGRASGRDQ